MKVALKFIVGLLVLVAVVIGGSVFYLDRLVAVAIEEAGPRVTGTPVQVEDVSLSPLGGDDVIVVRAIDVIDPVVVLEQGANGTNLAAMRDRLSRGTAASDASASTETPRKLIIERLTVTGARVAVSSQMLADRELGVAIPPIELTDIGKKSGGATLAEVTEQVLRALSDSANRSVVEENLLRQLGLDPDQVDKTRDVIEQTRDKIEGVLDVFR